MQSVAESAMFSGFKLAVGDSGSSMTGHYRAEMLISELLMLQHVEKQLLDDLTCPRTAELTFGYVCELFNLLLDLTDCEEKRVVSFPPKLQ